MSHGILGSTARMHGQAGLGGTGKQRAGRIKYMADIWLPDGPVLSWTFIAL